MDAIVLDFDGLILDTEWPAFVTVADVFRAHGSELTLEAWGQRIGRGDNGPWTELLDGFVAADLHAQIAEERRRRKDELTDAQPVMAGVVELLDAARDHGLALGVASSSPMSWVGRHLERLGLIARFHTVVTRDHVPRAKPWPDLFLAACAALGADPTRSLAFEDSVHGVTAAKAAGLHCIAVPNRVTIGGDFGHADLVLDSLHGFDLGAHVAGLGSR